MGSRLIEARARPREAWGREGGAWRVGAEGCGWRGWGGGWRGGWGRGGDCGGEPWGGGEQEAAATGAEAGQTAGEEGWRG